MINEIITNKLKDLNIPTYYLRTTQTHDKHIIFSIYNEKDTDITIDKVHSKMYFISLNYWYKNGNDYALYKEIIEKLTEDDDFIFEKSKDIMDKDYFGKSMDFIYNNVKEK